MKKVTSIVMSLALVATSMSVWSCSNAKEKTSIVEASMSMSVSSNDVLHGGKDIVTIYLAIKDALVKSDVTAAGAAAAELVVSIDGKSGMDELLSAATKISDTKDLKAQRVAFDTLSEQVYALVKAHNDSGKTLYKQYCPMALSNNGAYWLAAEEEVNNPYFGDMMLHCGSVKETLN